MATYIAHDQGRNVVTIMLSFGRWGGIYTHFGYTWRLCLGWVALTLVPCDIDDLLHAALEGVPEK